MKKILLVLLGIVILLIVVLAAVLYLTQGIADTADAFFDEVRRGNVEKAYNLYLSEEFRSTTGLEEFKDMAEGGLFRKFKSAEWLSRSLTGNEGELAGNIMTEDGITVPVELTLVKEEDGWKIKSIHKTAAVTVDDIETGTVPSDKRLKEMVNFAVLRLGTAINKNDFKAFHESLSAEFKAQSTPEALQNAFRSFIDRGIDLTLLKDIEPVFSETPQLDDDGVLVLTGYYPAEPPVTYFETKFVFEYPRWELYGIDISVR